MFQKGGGGGGKIAGAADLSALFIRLVNYPTSSSSSRCCKSLYRMGRRKRSQRKRERAIRVLYYNKPKRWRTSSQKLYRLFFWFFSSFLSFDSAGREHRLFRQTGIIVDRRRSLGLFSVCLFVCFFFSPGRANAVRHSQTTTTKTAIQ